MRVGYPNVYTDEVKRDVFAPERVLQSSHRRWHCRQFPMLDEERCVALIAIAVNQAAVADMLLSVLSYLPQRQKFKT